MKNEKNGLILIDPSYEIKDDYREVINFINQNYDEYSNKIILVWYPLLNRENTNEFINEFKKTGIKNILRIEMPIKNDEDAAEAFISKSHKWTNQFLPTKFLGHSYKHIDKNFEKIPDIESNRKNYKILSYELNPGDAIAFNFGTVHGAPGNKSNNRRRAFSARFTGDDARYIKRKGEMSPPFKEVKLKNGDVLDCKTFPIIYLKNSPRKINID